MLNTLSKTPKTFSSFIFIFFLFIATPVQAGNSIYTGIFSNVAVSGYDTVAYFTQGKPVKGSKEFSTTWKETTWLFSSAKNLALFEGDKNKYAPQYGGYCAYATANNVLAKGDPQQWHIENGKLYLNLNKDIKKTWLADRATYIPQADANYPNLIK